MRKLLGLVVILAAFSSCQKDSISIDCTGLTPSYNVDVKPIADMACAFSGCHGTNSGDGDFTTYAGLKKVAKNGRLTRHVVVNKDMPRPNTTGPNTLSDSLIQVFYCWVQNGSLEN